MSPSLGYSLLQPSGSDAQPASWEEQVLGIKSYIQQHLAEQLVLDLSQQFNNNPFIVRALREQRKSAQSFTSSRKQLKGNNNKYSREGTQEESYLK